MLALIEERDMPSINVQDITQRAQVNRTTFYLHYSNVEDLLDDAMDELIAELKAQTREFDMTKIDILNPGIPPNLPTWYTFLGERLPLFRKLFTAPIGVSFTTKLQALQEAEFLEAWEAHHLVAAEGTPPLEFRARYGAAAVLGVVSKWVTDEASAQARCYDIWTWELLLPLWTTMVAEPSGVAEEAPVARVG
ncbi:MAG: TetR/AcrR family transcriptional regulator [Thermomicrobiales bacterium]